MLQDLHYNISYKSSYIAEQFDEVLRLPVIPVLKKS